MPFCGVSLSSIKNLSDEELVNIPKTVRERFEAIYHELNSFCLNEQFMKKISMSAVNMELYMFKIAISTLFLITSPLIAQVSWVTPLGAKAGDTLTVYYNRNDPMQR